MSFSEDIYKLISKHYAKHKENYRIKVFAYNPALNSEHEINNEYFYNKVKTEWEEQEKKINSEFYKKLNVFGINGFLFLAELFKIYFIINKLYSPKIKSNVKPIVTETPEPSVNSKISDSKTIKNDEQSISHLQLSDSKESVQTSFIPKPISVIPTRGILENVKTEDSEESAGEEPNIKPKLRKQFDGVKLNISNREEICNYILKLDQIQYGKYRAKLYLWGKEINH